LLTYVNVGLSDGLFREPPDANAAESDVYLAVDSFVWKKFDDDGSRLPKGYARAKRRDSPDCVQRWYSIKI
jgi:hypothetical protein